MENPRIELFALCRSLRNRQIDEEDYSSSPELTIEQNESKVDLILKPMLREGRHVMKCTVVNPDHNRRTVIERVFTVHSLSQPSRRDVNLNLEALSHSVLEGRNLQERTPSMMTSYGLEYTTSHGLVALDAGSESDHHLYHHSVLLLLQTNREFHFATAKCDDNSVIGELVLRD